MRNQWYIVFPAMILLLLGFRRWKKTETGRRWWDRTRIRIPAGIGRVMLKVGMARFSRTLSSLVGAGVDIMQALEITGSTSGNSLIEDAVKEVRDKVQQGTSIAQPLTSRRSSRRWSRTLCASARRPASSSAC
jgi:type IV pilus assembly protein PilC